MNTEIVFREALESLLDHENAHVVAIASEALRKVDSHYRMQRNQIKRESEEFSSRILPWIEDRKSKGLPLISACEMSIGQKGKVIAPGKHFRKILVRVENGAVRFDGKAGEGIETWAFAGGKEPHSNGPYVEVLSE